MSVKSTTDSIEQSLVKAYDAVSTMHGTLPEEKNLENLAAAIDSIVLPTFEGLKEALDAGDAQEKFPVGTVIKDTYDGESNPLIIAHYLDSTNNSSYGGAEGALLVRKYALSTKMYFGANTSATSYLTSVVKEFLDGEYATKCSPEVQSAISNISIPYYDGSKLNSVPCKWFIMSDTELDSDYATVAEGVSWRIWQKFSGDKPYAPSHQSDSDRVTKTADGTKVNTWTRTRYMTSFVEYVNTSGGLGYALPDTNYYVRPACFIAKGKSYDPSNPTLEGIKEALKAGDYDAFPVGTEIPDVYDGNSNPLIVVQYLNGTLSEGYYNGDALSGPAVGAILLRKYVDPATIWFGSVGKYYSVSNALKYLEGEYMAKCSDELKSIISEIGVSYWGGSSYWVQEGKWFLPSAKEVNTGNRNDMENIEWTYYTNSMASATDNATPIRIATMANGAPVPYWLRTNYGSSYWSIITATGAKSFVAPNNANAGLLPACFISKD